MKYIKQILPLIAIIILLGYSNRLQLTIEGKANDQYCALWDVNIGVQGFAFGAVIQEGENQVIYDNFLMPGIITDVIYDKENETVIITTEKATEQFYVSEEPSYQIGDKLDVALVQNFDDTSIKEVSPSNIVGSISNCKEIK